VDQIGFEPMTYAL